MSSDTTNDWPTGHIQEVPSVLRAERNAAMQQLPHIRELEAACAAKDAALSAEPCTTCGYTAWRISAETGKRLYCEVCDQRQQKADMLSDIARVKAEAAKMREAAANVANTLDRVADEYYPTNEQGQIDEHHAAYLRGRSDALSQAADRIRHEVIGSAVNGEGGAM